MDAALIEKWLFHLRPEIHSHSVRAALGSTFTHLIHEVSRPGGAGGVIIRPIVRRCRDHDSIAIADLEALSKRIRERLKASKILKEDLH